MVTTRHHGHGPFRNRGFSLFELMIALAILGIMSSLAIGGFQYLVRDQTVRNYTFELFSSLSLARNEAVKRNGDVTITPATGGWQNGWTITFGGATLKNKTASGGVTVSTAPASIVYNRSGRLTTASAQFDIADTNTHSPRCVTIDLSGLPKTERGTCS